MWFANEIKDDFAVVRGTPRDHATWRLRRTRTRARRRVFDACSLAQRLRQQADNVIFLFIISTS